MLSVQVEGIAHNSELQETVEAKGVQPAQVIGQPGSARMSTATRQNAIQSTDQCAAISEDRIQGISKEEVQPQVQAEGVTGTDPDTATEFQHKKETQEQQTSCNTELQNAVAPTHAPEHTLYSDAEQCAKVHHGAAYHAVDEGSRIGNSVASRGDEGVHMIQETQSPQPPPTTGTAAVPVGGAHPAGSLQGAAVANATVQECLKESAQTQLSQQHDPVPDHATLPAANAYTVITVCSKMFCWKVKC